MRSLFWCTDDEVDRIEVEPQRSRACVIDGADEHYVASPGSLYLRR